MWKVSFWQILLQKSFRGDVRKFLEPLMRLTRGDVRDQYHFIQNRSRVPAAAGILSAPCVLAFHLQVICY